MSPGHDTPVAVVTGGARRLGRRLCSMLAARGYDLVVLYRTSKQDARSLVREVEATGRCARALAADIGVERDVAAVFDDIAAVEGLIVDRHDLRLPDPEILTRAYLALPLADVAPGFRHPIEGLTLGEIAARFGDEPGVRRRADVRWP